MAVVLFYTLQIFVLFESVRENLATFLFPYNQKWALLEVKGSH